MAAPDMAAPDMAALGTVAPDMWAVRVAGVRRRAVPEHLRPPRAAPGPAGVRVRRA